MIASGKKKKKVCTKCHTNTNWGAILLGKEEDIKMFGKEVMYELPERKLGILKQMNSLSLF